MAKLKGIDLDAGIKIEWFITRPAEIAKRLNAWSKANGLPGDFPDNQFARFEGKQDQTQCKKI